jgi:hypothetical protein
MNSNMHNHLNQIVVNNSSYQNFPIHLCPSVMPVFAEWIHSSTGIIDVYEFGVIALLVDLIFTKACLAFAL